MHPQLLLDLRQIHTVLLHLFNRKDQFQLSGDHPQQTEYRSPRFQKIIKKSQRLVLTIPANSVQHSEHIVFRIDGKHGTHVMGRDLLTAVCNDFL